MKLETLKQRIFFTHKLHKDYPSIVQLTGVLYFKKKFLINKRVFKSKQLYPKLRESLKLEIIHTILK